MVNPLQFICISGWRISIFQQVERVEQRRQIVAKPTLEMPHHHKYSLIVFISQRFLPTLLCHHQPSEIKCKATATTKSDFIRDMFHDATYMNRLTVLREDLLAELCQGHTITITITPIAIIITITIM